MRSTVAGNTKQLIVRVSGWLIATAAMLFCFVSVANAQQSMVAATVCRASSSITLTQPVSDSTVTQSPVTIAGTVDQANQIEIYVDDGFDSVIPLSVGQTSFSGSVEIPQGTHTIKVVAVNICPGPNGSDSSVVTFAPPPTTGGTGEQTQTQTTAEPSPPVSSEKDSLPILPFVPGEAGKTFQEIGRWLNITATYEAPAMPRLTLGRATTIAVGSWLLAFGIATTVVQWLGSTLPLFGNMPATKRARIIGWIIRGIGLLMVLGGIFL